MGNNKTKKPVTGDQLVMWLIVGGLLLALVGFVTYNFGMSAGRKSQAQLEEDMINKEVNKTTQAQKDAQEKYKDIYEVVVPNGVVHDSEPQYDGAIYKKDYPLLNYAYSEDSDWQVIINLNQTDPESMSLVCADTTVINQFCESLYTYVSPLKNQIETDNAIYVFRNGQIYELLYCERVYFTSQQFRDAFEEIPTVELNKYFE